MAEKLICSVVRGAIPLSIGAPRTDFRSGCSTIEVTFPNSNSTNSSSSGGGSLNAVAGSDGAIDVGEIHFRNYYVAFLTVRVRLKGAADDEDVWRTMVKNKRLMDDPHSEKGSHDLCILSRRDIWGSGAGLLSTSSLPGSNPHSGGAIPMVENVVALRFILRQPSPVWKDFYLDDIKIYAPPPSEPHHAMLTLPEFLKREENAQRRPDKAKMANIVLPNVGAVSMELQQLWGLTELLKANQPTVGVGRYDVDGSYDINLLSYA